MKVLGKILLVSFLLMFSNLQSQENIPLEQRHTFAIRGFSAYDSAMIGWRATQQGNLDTLEESEQEIIRSIQTQYPAVINFFLINHSLTRNSIWINQTVEFLNNLFDHHPNPNVTIHILDISTAELDLHNPLHAEENRGHCRIHRAQSYTPVENASQLLDILKGFLQ